jgi:hypothetical protein
LSRALYRSAPDAVKVTLLARTNSPYRSRIDDLAALALGVLLFYSRVAGFLHSLLTPLLLLLLLVLASCDLDIEIRRLSGRSLVVAAYVMFGILFCRVYARTDGAVVAVTLEHFAVLLPLSAVVGWALVTSGKLRLYLSWQLLIGTLTVAPALYEWYSGSDLFQSASAFARNGRNRAVVGAEHPLVLGALFLALMPIALWLVRGWLGYLNCIALYVGVWATGGNGAEIIGGVLLGLLLVPPVTRRLLATWYALTGLLTLLAGYLGIGGIWLWSAQVHGTSSTAVSNGYREALYHLLPRLLVVKPFGYGLGGLPANTWYVGTQVSGITDISKSIDSELVLAVANFGWIALIGYLTIMGIGVAASVNANAVGLSSLTLTLVGLFVAIHAWTSLGCFWFIGIGACSAILRHRYFARTATTPNPAERFGK